MEIFSNNILLSNLIKIRWIAIIGQILAILIVFYGFEILIPIIPCLAVVLISSVINTYSYFTNYNDNHLSDKEAFYFLLFDTIQLCILLYLTGGIYNPFSLLLIAPLVISAAYLPIVYSILLLFLTIFCVLLISNFYFKINWNESFFVPQVFQYGLTLSLIISLIFISIYVYLFANSSRKISEALTKTRSALADQKKISEIGSLSAAAVHELSTPLNTIFLILDDLQEELTLNENNYVKKEIDLLKSQAQRCKKILLTLSKNPENLKDNFLNKTTISNLININFEKFNDRSKKLNLNIISDKNEPLIFFKDELVYCIGNIIQNAIQHAKLVVTANISWTEKEFIITIIDDGVGFKNEILDQVGKPYISTKKKGISMKKKGMGLGIFIAKNLIENIDGSIKFQNIINNGASVEIKIKHDS